MQPHLAPTATALRRTAVALLLLAFVLAQSLGWMHRAVHGTGGAASAMSAGVHASADAPREQAEAGIAGLFRGHADASDCRLFDALAQPGCAASALVVLPLSLPAAILAAAYGEFVARWSALFDARGPPSSR